MRKSLQISLTAIFAALHAILYFVSFGLWRNWGIYLESIEGILLGPSFGFSAAFMGSVIARMVKPDAFWMFGIVAEPFSVLIAGFLSRAKWKPVLAAYVVMLSAYFISPFGRALPLWTVLDILLAIFLVYPAARLSKNLHKDNIKGLSISLVLISFVCVAADSLVRVFMLIPGGLHSLFFSDFNTVYAVFVMSAVDSYIEDCITVAVSFFVGVPLLVSVFKLRLLERRKR